MGHEWYKDARRVQVGVQGTSRCKGQEWAQVGMKGEGQTLPLATYKFMNSVDFTPFVWFQKVFRHHAMVKLIPILMRIISIFTHYKL